MTLTVLELEVQNPAKPDVKEKVELLVDSGILHSVVPTTILEGLGIVPYGEKEFRLADGSKLLRRKGIALLRYHHHVGAADVIFGEEGDTAMVGSSTLASLGFVLDPLRRELKP